MSSSQNILVTGFGPFGSHETNASWESVKLLPDTIEGFTVIKEEVPVSYEHVDSRICHFWEQYKPQLVVHVGVSEKAKNITFESCAHKRGYQRIDVCGRIAGTCPRTTSGECLRSEIDIKDICEYLNSKKIIGASVSDDAGRYLCEYIYYTSLSVDSNRTLFIHVPKLDEPYSAQEIADGLSEVIRCALKQLNEIACKNNTAI